MPPDEEAHLDEFQDGMQSWGGDVVFGQNTLEAICQVCEWCFHSSSLPAEEVSPATFSYVRGSPT